MPVPLTSESLTIRAEGCRKALRWIAAVVALGLAAHLAVLLWAQHDFTSVEPLIALQSNMLTHGEGLYWGVNRYPYTISAYGPIFYAASGYLHLWGVPAYQSGRIVSFIALAAGLWLCWQILGYLTKDTLARFTGLILAASTANLLFWGSAGQTDMLACCFSLAAFAAFLKSREGGRARHLVLSGIFVILAVFTKQTFLTAGAVIGLTLLWNDRKRASWWIPAVALAGTGIAITLNLVTHNGYFEDAVLANMNPLAWFKLRQQAQYLALTGTGVVLIAVIGALRVSSRTAPLYLYAALAGGVWLLTAPKVGSDLNYQIEVTLALCMCAAVALDNFQFFPSLIAGRRTWTTFLQLPLLLHVAVNVLVTARNVAGRVAMEEFNRQETETLRPFVERPGRLLSTQYDSLVHYRGRIEVEPLIYSLLVRAGVTDPAPLTRDLADRRFDTLMIGANVFTPEPAPAVENVELGSLPQAQIDAIRKNYRLVKQVDGPNTVYIYEPRRD